MNEIFPLIDFTEKKNLKFKIFQFQAQKDEQWGDKVEVVSGDMREWKDGGIKADIIVSELLGSFGDNELSPECLYR